MFRDLTYKQRLKLLGVAGMLALVLCYKLSITRTIDEYRKYARETELSGALNGADRPSLAGLRARTDLVSGLMNLFALDTLNPEKNLLSAASNYCKVNHLQLKEYKPYALSQTDSIRVMTRTVTIGGAFVPSLKFLYTLEKERRIGRVSSADFKSYMDPKDKTLKLDCTIYIQNLISNEDHP